MEAQSVPKVCKLILARLIDSMLGKIFKVLMGGEVMSKHYFSPKWKNMMILLYNYEKFCLLKHHHLATKTLK
jgi:hypothetical protein